jgi:ABC-2 type transport system permease protein
MLKSIIRLLAFFAKEINEVRRQPRLIASLLLGPFLILFLFGIGYKGSQPELRTAVVLPADAQNTIDPATLDQASRLNFQLVSIDDNRELAMQRLRNGELDVVQIFPTNIRDQLLQGAPATIDFVYNEINPLNEQWINYLAYAEVVELNRSVLVSGIDVAQQEARGNQSQLAETRTQLEQVESGLQASDPATLQASLRRLRAASGVLLVSALLAQGGTSGTTEGISREEIVQLQSDLDALDQAISNGQLAEQQQLVSSTLEKIKRLEDSLNLFTSVPPGVIASPFERRFENMNGTSYDLTTYYAPGILALIIQHIGVTLGALALVRERLLGASEIFSIAPVSSGHMLFGKYLAYIVFIGLMTALLVGLMLLLNVPFLGDPLLFAITTLLLAIAGISVGFCISALSRSESQAVQLSMLVLLLSIFFGGFFLALDSFYPAARWVSYALPLTHGIQAFQAIMLQGQAPTLEGWYMLGIITFVAFTGCVIFWRLGRRST